MAHLRRTPSLLICAISLTALLAGGCGGPAEPVARLSVEPQVLTLPYPGTAEVQLSFEPLPGGEAPSHVFVHLLDANGQVVRTFDHPYPGNADEAMSYPVRLWQSALALPLPAGSYRLSVGVWEPESGNRRPLEVAEGEEIDGGEYAVATVEVTAPPAGAPAVRYQGDWLDAQTGGDLQVPVQRWLGEGGAFTLSPLAGPVTLRLLLSMPRLDPGQHRLVLDEGVEAPLLVVSSDCAEGVQEIREQGQHEVVLALDPGPEATSCTVRLAPNFRYIDLASFARRSVNLLALSWDLPQG